jgi:hypothetical protein
LYIAAQPFPLRFARNLPIAVHGLSPQERRNWPANQFHSLKSRPAIFGEQVFSLYRPPTLRIDNHNIGVFTHF